MRAVFALLRALLPSPSEDPPNEVGSDTGTLFSPSEEPPNEVGSDTGTLFISVFICRGSSKAAITCDYRL